MSSLGVLPANSKMIHGSESKNIRPKVDDVFQASSTSDFSSTNMVKSLEAEVGSSSLEAGDTSGPGANSKLVGEFIKEKGEGGK